MSLSEIANFRKQNHFITKAYDWKKQTNTEMYTISPDRGRYESNA